MDALFSPFISTENIMWFYTMDLFICASGSIGSDVITYISQYLIGTNENQMKGRFSKPYTVPPSQSGITGAQSL